MPITFDPPTYFQPILRKTPHDALWRFFDGIPTGQTVLIVGGAASTYPGLVAPTEEVLATADAGSGHNGLAAFIGGHQWTLTSAEATILVAAGYTTAGGGEFDLDFSVGFDIT